MGELGKLHQPAGGDGLFAPPATAARPPYPPVGAYGQPVSPAGSSTQAYADGPDAQPTRQINTRSKPKLSTWSGRMVALRINRKDRLYTPKPDPKPLLVDTIHPPRLLRFWRLLAGIGLLVAAWGGVLLLVEIAFNLANTLPSRIYPTEAFALFLLSAVGAVWLAVVTLGCILVGAFALALSLGRRGW